MKTMIGAILLAAGQSKRLGRPKQLISLDGKTLLGHSIDAVQTPKIHSTVVVLGFQFEMIRKSIDTSKVHLANNLNWKEGMGTSLSFGLKELLQIAPELENVLVLLSDQPRVTATLIEALIDEHLCSNQSITACQYNRIVGVPAIFNRIHFAEILKLNAETGAKTIINQNLSQVKLVRFDGGQFDIDTEEDLIKFKNKYSVLKVKYFGMIAEKAGKTEEILQLEKVGNTIEEVRAYCVKEYDLGSVPTFQIALNQSITQSGKLIPGDEVAFLPPFAGG